MADPFRIDSPTCISFSGGRTSAYMLWRVLQSNDGLPSEAVVCFANTGKEDEATLEFVRDCERNWDVPIVWLEYQTEQPGFRVVSFETASRDGEPFESIIRKRQYLPNPVTRFCTSELKIRPMHKYLRSMCWDKQFDGWDQMIGIRADEQRRVSKIRARGHSTETTKDTMCLPLADAGVTVETIDAFWKAQPFTLNLPTYKGRTLAGNCDLCYLKPQSQVQSLIAEKPERAFFWIRMEALGIASKPSGARFRSDRPSYAEMLKYSQQQDDLFDGGEEPMACFCGE